MKRAAAHGLFPAFLLIVAGAAAGQPEFDPAHPPAMIGESLARVLSRWGEAASFGADCGSWRGPSVDTLVRWQGDDLRVMALLRGDRVTALRYERPSARSLDFGQCLWRMEEFAREWKSSGVELGSGGEPQWDGPVRRYARRALSRGVPVGRFEAEFRASREECRIAIIAGSE